MTSRVECVLIFVSLSKEQVDHESNFDVISKDILSLDQDDGVKALTSFEAMDYKYSKWVLLVSDMATKSVKDIADAIHQYIDNQKIKLDTYFNTLEQWNHCPRIAAFDMDSCLIKNECIDEMAVEMSVVEKVSEITRRAMEGQYNFDQALMERLALLKGMTLAQLEQVWTRIELNPGAYAMVQTLKHLGFKVALVSGGFTFFSHRVGARLGMDYVYSNQLELVDGCMTGGIIGSILNGDMKLKILQELSTLNQCEQRDTLAMGDGSNDRYMVAYAHLGVAYHAKSVLKASTPFHINHTPLQSVCFFLSKTLPLLTGPSSEIRSLLTELGMSPATIHDIKQEDELIRRYNNDQPKLL
ncbi:hypothetical protein SAMD00019534_089060 [Acytostelium subglobosum LB1]|uniref:hypothetical protein n=1 Tax=Acytostelium subglobosum LB1 TaxID=1410327 RepID=UPI0006451F7A|nr:hypothetical protein SAMD00019534_089060 [Acytostelium subglobosum LB1]GAM25731.1 hypothetical protein SAMD00019534_089060 [Acytostelium subglobosum LB1]|eukprot:XP_012751249.1 hypothetical protein SAMD00019534_089060 [Acytostelium subglobosum LB1]